MNSSEIRKKFLDFFAERGHKVVPSSSTVPENDASVLFTTAGMQQFKPYYVGAKDVESDFGTRNLTSSQKCIRTNDIDEVGDETHLTFFEMLGNFSFGGYFKEEAIKYAHELITKGFGLKIDYVSVFGGEHGVPEDTESAEIWKSIDPSLEVRKFGRSDNFWGPTGDEGPCGPTTEIYVNGVEVWNIVFNEFYQSKDGSLKPLDSKGIDTGMGFERLVVQIQQKASVYETDIFESLMKATDSRITADHIRTSCFLIADGITPSNNGRGYILRRLLRRAYVKDRENIEKVIDAALELPTYKGIYEFSPNTKEVIFQELDKFKKTLDSGIKQIEKGADPFVLFTSYGFPIELTEEIAKEKGISIDRAKFDEDMRKHQELSRASADKKFKN